MASLGNLVRTQKVKELKHSSAGECLLTFQELWVAAPLPHPYTKQRYTHKKKKKSKEKSH